MLELLVAVFLTGILLAIAVPTTLGAIDGYRLNTSARMVAGRMFEARVNAIKRNRATRLVIDAVRQDVRIETANDAGGTVQIGERERVAAGVRFVAGATPAVVSFDATGRPTGLGAAQIDVSLTAVAGARNRVVTVTLTQAGNIRVR